MWMLTEEETLLMGAGRFGPNAKKEIADKPGEVIYFFILGNIIINMMKFCDIIFLDVTKYN